MSCSALREGDPQRFFPHSGFGLAGLQLVGDLDRASAPNRHTNIPPGARRAGDCIRWIYATRCLSLVCLGSNCRIIDRIRHRASIGHKPRSSLIFRVWTPPRLMRETGTPSCALLEIEA
jgi:hypothetical protein